MKKEHFDEEEWIKNQIQSGNIEKAGKYLKQGGAKAPAKKVRVKKAKKAPAPKPKEVKPKESFYPDWFPRLTDKKTQENKGKKEAEDNMKSMLKKRQDLQRKAQIDRQVSQSSMDDYFEDEDNSMKSMPKRTGMSKEQKALIDFDKKHPDVVKEQKKKDKEDVDKHFWD